MQEVQTSGASLCWKKASIPGGFPLKSRATTLWRLTSGRPTRSFLTQRPSCCITVPVDMCLLEPLIGSRVLTALWKAQGEPRPRPLRDNSFQLPFSALLEECFSPALLQWLNGFHLEEMDRLERESERGSVGSVPVNKGTRRRRGFHVTPSSVTVHGSGTLPEWPDLHFLDRLGKTYLGPSDDSSRWGRLDGLFI